MRIQGWLRSGLASVIFLIVLNVRSGRANHNLRVAYKWKFLDYNWPDENTRQLFSHYVRENHNPLGIEVADNRIFITIPRWRNGIVATLNYIYLNDTSESPLLNPYPSWEANKYTEDHPPEIISVFRIRADRCGRLWVLDTGLADRHGRRIQEAPPSLIVYDLNTDQVLRKYVIPAEDPKQTFFTNVAVEDAFCDDTFAYLTDSKTPALVVYSWLRNESWQIKHHYFHPDPLHANFNVSGLSFQWWDALIGLGLAPKSDGYSTLYFHPLCTTKEFSVDTRLLRDSNRVAKSLSDASIFHQFKVLGSRGHNGQGAASFLDPTTGILFHAISIGNYVACWRPGTEYNVRNIGRVHEDHINMIMPSDIKVDRQGNIWVVSDRLPIFMYSQLDFDDYNFRIFTGTVEEAIRGTVCAEE